VECHSRAQCVCYLHPAKILYGQLICFTDTKEGLESCFVVSYYSRLRLISNLLPLIHSSPSPRVLSILNGTKEKAIDETDIGLEKENAWGIAAVVNHTTLCTSLAFDYLAANDAKKHVTFLHATPGFVNTDTPRTTFPSMKDGVIRWALVSTFQVVSGWIIRWYGISAKEAGERHAYHLTNEKLVPGSWRVDKFSDVAKDNKTLERYQERQWGEVVWEFTNKV
jgi:hypothetical protein